MAKARITDVMMDDTSINVKKEVDLVFSIANSLRGPYKSEKYKDVIIPMIIIRRFECALAETKKAVVETFEAKRDIPPQILEKTAGYGFYNTSRYTLAELLNDADNIVSNFKSYIDGFSANVQSIIRNLDFEKEIDKMDKNNRLLGVVRKFSELDLHPGTIDGIKAGYMFEEIIRRFSENAEAGDHYTPREVIRLLVSVLLAEGLDDMQQLLFMQHAIKKMSKDGRAAIISNGSPLFSGNTTSGESQIRRYMLENDLIETIIALPTDLFYNTSIGIYAFILSKDKRPERRGKIQLINAVDMYKPIKSLGKKRKEISKSDIRNITEIYSDFKEGKFCKIFDNEDFLYKEYAVYQPLQRRGSISSANIAALKSSALFTANSRIFNEAEYDVLLETNPREGGDEKKFQGYVKGKEFTETVIAALEEKTDYTEYDDFAEFSKKLKEIIGDIEGMTDSRLNQIAMEMSEMDKTAVIQKDKKGNVIVDPTTKDSEIIGLKIDVEDYFKHEVYPHIPDAVYAYEYDSNKKATSANKEKLGAELPFTRYFYEYKAPEKADNLLAQFAEVEQGLSARMTSLLGGDDMSWIIDVPAGWKKKRLKYLGSARNGLTYTPEDVTDEGILVLRSSNIQNSELAFEDNVYVKMSIPHEIVLQENDLLICSRNGSRDLIGKCALIDKKTAGNTYGAFMCVYRSAYNQFIHYVLLSDIFDFYLGTFLTSTINQLTNANLLNIEVLLPSLPEQEAIVAFLDDRCGQVDGIIADLERQVEILRQYKKALITETVTKGLDKSAPMENSGIYWIGEMPKHYVLKKLKHLVATKITDGPHETPDLIDDGIPFLSAESVKDGILNFEYKRGFISRRDHETFCKKCKPKQNDIFMVKSGATTGKTGIVMTNEEFSVWSPLALVRCDDVTVIQKFVYYAMLSEYFIFSVEQSWSFGTQQNIGMGVIENLPIVLPPTNEQFEIAAFLDVKSAEIDELIAEKQKAAEVMRQYKKSLIYEYVTGKKRVAFGGAAQ